MDIDLITKNMLKQTLSPNPEQLYALRGELLDMPEYYITAAPGTSRQDWDNKEFTAYIDQKKTLAAFLTQMEAEASARRHGCVLESGEYMVVSKDNDAFARLVAQYASQKVIDSIKIYARAPIGLLFAPSDFAREEQEAIFTDKKPAPEKIPAAKPVSEKKVPVAKRVFCGVDEVKTALETYEINARRKLDKGARYENIHTLIQSLAQQNGIDPTDLDNTLSLNIGYTRRFFVDVKTLDPGIDVMKKYLSFFGLERYLYIFKSDSKELIRYLNTHKIIDKYKLKTPPAASAERFKIEKIEQGMDDGAYVYKISMTSDKGNSIQTVVSNPLKPPLVIGKEYQLMNRDGSPRDEDAAPLKITAAAALPSEAAMLAILEQLDEKDSSKIKKKNESREDSRSYEEVRKDDIIKHFRKQGLDGRSASAKYKDLEIEEDILDEFYKYIQNRQFGKLEIQGYTPRKLIKEMHMEPYEAFLSLVQLRADPQNTKQRLIYRERDPQYQKPPKDPKGKEGKKQ